MTSISLDHHDSITTGATRRGLAALLGTSNDVTLTLLRLTLGLIMLPHGLQKTIGLFGGYGFQGTMGFFTSMGIPAVLAFLAIAAESAGAIALIAGFGTRIAAFGVGTVMAVAVLTVHRANGFFMNWYGNQKGEGFEYHLLAIGIALALIIRGAGRFSVDRAIADKL